MILSILIILIIAIACMAWRYIVMGWIGFAIVYAPIHIMTRIIQMARG